MSDQDAATLDRRLRLIEAITRGEGDDELFLRGFSRDVHELAKSKGWHDEQRSFSDYCALLHSEVSEAFEEYRANRGVTETYLDESGKPCGIPIELADVLIRLLDTSEALGIDLIGAAQAKHEYNATRSHRHGGKVL